jgi:hypothetical protein
MASKHLSTFYHDNKKEYCEIYVDYKEEMMYIKYYKKDGHAFFHLEDFPNKSLTYVESAAENWALGIKTIEEPMYGKTLFD